MSRKHTDITGQKFGMLTATEYIGGSKWVCECDCGNTSVVRTNRLLGGYTTACGCQRYKTPLKNEIGNVYGMLTVIAFAYIKRGAYWICSCECGNTTTVMGTQLRRKKEPTRSCGCQISSAVDETDKQYGKWTVLSQAPSQGDTAMWTCKCECGTISDVYGFMLRSGRSQSCGKCTASVLTDEQRQLKRNISGYGAWRSAVLSRDSYTCQACGTTNGIMVAHHILAYALFPDLQLDVDNGLTMCQTCHIEFHNLYGKMPDTNESIQEYIKGLA